MTKLKLSLFFIIALALVFVAGCRDKEKELEGRMVPALDEVFPLIERDTKQVRDGIKPGAELLGKHLDDDPGADPEGAKRAIQKARAGVHELTVAKSTFFVFATSDGKVLRGEVEPDLAAGHSLTEAIPDSKKLFEDDAGTVEAWGYMNGLRGVNKGSDLQWIVGHPVKAGDKRVGAFVTGWSFRKYAEYLENHVRRHLEQTQEDKTKPTPLFYVFIIKDNVAYGGPITPDSNAEAIGGLDLVGKAKDGLHESRIELDGRAFLLAAKPAPLLGEGVVVALVMSPV